MNRPFHTEPAMHAMPCFVEHQSPAESGAATARTRWRFSASEFILTWVVTFSVFIALAPAHAQDSAKPNDIVVGHSYPGSGVLAEVGNQMKSGLDVALSEANAAGGIKGRRIRVISMDDGFNEERTLKNAQKLVTEDQVLALMCPVGAPHLAKLKPYAEEARFPIVGARAGPDPLRKYSRYVFFNHASFGDEVDYLAKQLSTLGIKRVSIAYVTLPFGKDLLERFMTAAEKRGVVIEKSVPFGVAGEDMALTAGQLANTKSQAFVLIGTGTNGTNFAKQMVAHGVKSQTIYGFSVLSVQELIRDLGPDSNGMVLSQVMPSPVATKLPVVKQYQAALKKFSKDAPSQFGLEAYIAGRILVEGLKRIKGPITRESLTTSLEGLGTLDLGGFFVTYNDQSHHGARFVHLAIISRGQLVY
jgi:branched-chain amino acid transport system substrate-binding protein